MIGVAKAINSFLPTEQQANFVPPSDQFITLTIGQLEDLIKEAIQPLQDEISDLKATVASQGEKIATMETIELQDVDRLALDIAYDRQRLSKLENKEPGPTNEDRAEKLKAYLTVKKDAGQRPEISFTEARTYLEVSRSQFSQLISKLDPRDFVISTHPLNYKAKMIGLARKM